MDTPSEEALAAAYDKAPKEINLSLSEGSTLDFIMGMQNRYKLHADVVGIVAGIIRDTLLGLSTPGVFVDKLIEAGLDEAAAKTFTADINKEVFLPLRDSILKVEDIVPEPSVKASRSESIPVMKVGEPETKAKLVELPKAQEQPAQPSYNLIHSEPAKKATASAPTVTNSTTVTEIPAPRTMQGDMNALAHPESIVTAPAIPNVPHPWQMSPAQSFQTASVPYNLPTPAIRPNPIQTPIENERVVTPSTLRDPATTVAAAQPEEKAIIKDYGNDPYREPI